MNNKNPKVIHETILKDIMDIWDGIKSLKDVDAFRKTKNPMGSSSIAKASSNLNLVFPVICSRNIAIENSSMISKAVEKNAVTMLQRLFASCQLAQNGVENVQDYISQFHTNISSSAASLDDLFELSNKVDKIHHNSAIVNQSIKSDLSNLNFYLPESINESSLSSFSVKEGAVSFDKKVGDKDNTEANKVGSASRIKEKEIDLQKKSAEYFKNQVSDSDFKKANELMPTTMTVNFKVKTDDGNDVFDYTNAVIGVKAKLYPIGSEDIVKHISEKSSDKNWITNFFRATTREISFMKDFILALDKAKIDALSLSTRKSTSDRMWKVLERRATVSRLKKALRQNNTAAAITTLCVSQEEVEYLRKNHNVDLEKISTVLGLFDTLNLMAICIVDESLEVAKFIYDEQEPMWETISFTHLERESSDNTYKRVVNLMTKVAR
mgnify:CR=1 FL=1